MVKIQKVNLKQEKHTWQILLPWMNTDERLCFYTLLGDDLRRPVVVLKRQIRYLIGLHHNQEKQIESYQNEFIKCT